MRPASILRGYPWLLLFAVQAAGLFSTCGSELRDPLDQLHHAASALESLYAGHSVTDSLGEITDRAVHYDTILRVLKDAFGGSEDSGPASGQVGHYGIDVSHHQGDINWEEVATDEGPHPVRFVFMKATQGISMVDDRFKQNWESAKKHQLRVGAYHFYQYREDPRQQAAHYIRNVPLGAGDLVPVVDVEMDCSKCKNPGVTIAQMIADLRKYIAAIEQHYGVAPLIYTYEHFYEDHLKGHFPGYYYWMARYSSTPPANWLAGVRQDARSEPRIALWQFTDSAKMKGIDSRVDMNFLIGKLEDRLIISAGSR